MRYEQIMIRFYNDVNNNNNEQRSNAKIKETQVSWQHSGEIRDSSIYFVKLCFIVFICWCFKTQMAGFCFLVLFVEPS